MRKTYAISAVLFGFAAVLGALLIWMRPSPVSLPSPTGPESSVSGIKISVNHTKIPASGTAVKAFPPTTLAAPLEGDPIPELDAAEEAYAAAQKALDEEASHLQRETADASPEDRRDRFMAWANEKREALQAQAERSQAIQKLYDKYQIPGPPGPVALMMSAEPGPEAGTDSAIRRLWTLQLEAAQMKERYADSPEKLRDALTGWDAVNGRKVRELIAEVDAGTHQDSDQGLPHGPVDLMMSVEPGPEAGTDSAIRRLWTLQLEAAQLKERYADHPEQLRDALTEWDAANNQKVRELTAAIEAETIQAPSAAAAGSGPPPFIDALPDADPREEAAPGESRQQDSADGV